MAAVQSGRLTRERIQESVVKILAAKEKVGLDRKRFVDLESISDVVDSPESNERAQEIADHAVTLVRNGGGMLPLAAPEKACYVIMTESRTSSEGQGFTQEVRKVAPKATLNTWDPTMSRQQLDEAVGRLAGCESYVVAAFTSVGAYRGTVGMLGGELPHALEAADCLGQAGGADRAGQPLCAAQLRRCDGVPGDVQQRSAQRDCGGARDSGSDSDHRAHAGHDSGAGGVRRRDSDEGYPGGYSRGRAVGRKLKG